jgi:hypothetical protein
MKRLIALLMAGFLLAALASCSSEDSGTDESTDQSAESSTTETTEDNSSDGGSSDDGDTPNVGDIGNLDDCIEAGQVYASVIAAPFAFLGGAASEEQIAEWESQVEEFRDKVPSELEDDYETLRNAYDQFAQELEGLSLSDLFNPATQDALQEATALIESDEVKSAQENLEEYYQSNCGQ